MILKKKNRIIFNRVINASYEHFNQNIADHTYPHLHNLIKLPMNYNYRKNYSVLKFFTPNSDDVERHDRKSNIA